MPGNYPSELIWDLFPLSGTHLGSEAFDCSTTSSTSFSFHVACSDEIFLVFPRTMYQQTYHSSYPTSWHLLVHPRLKRASKRCMTMAMRKISNIEKSGRFFGNILVSERVQPRAHPPPPPRLQLQSQPQFPPNQRRRVVIESLPCSSRHLPVGIRRVARATGPAGRQWASSETGGIKQEVMQRARHRSSTSSWMASSW